MTPELARVLERVRQARASSEQRARATRTQVLAPAASSGKQFAMGGRAFDLVTGLEAEVIGVGTENVIIPASK